MMQLRPYPVRRATSIWGVRPSRFACPEMSEVVEVHWGPIGDQAEGLCIRGDDWARDCAAAGE